MMYKRTPVIILSGACFGCLIAFAYINPYDGKIVLSELVLQLSGSRGNIPLGFSLPELLSFCAKIAPYFLLELYIGTNLYRHFCTASVYIFSRTSNRSKWYTRECYSLAISTLFYQIIFLGTAIGITCLRYQVIWTSAGCWLLLLHIILYSLWAFSMALLVNTLAILIGSGSSFSIVVIVQIILITMITMSNPLKTDCNTFSVVLNVNPITHLILGWQISSAEWLNEIIHAPWDTLTLRGSLLYMVAVTALTLLFGWGVIYKRDLIIADPEFGGM